MPLTVDYISFLLGLCSMASPILEGFLVGILSAVAIVYAFQTRNAYPDFVLNAINHPWIIVSTFIVALLMFNWSPTAASLLFLILSALVIDLYMFARPLPTLMSESPSERLSHQSAAAAHGNDEIDANIHQAPPLNAVALPQPMYPFYASTDEVRGGPAPF